MFEIYRECTFSASHQLRNYNGKCERLHGHNWRIRVHVSGEQLDKSGMLLDFHELDAIMKEAIDVFDHRHLNEVEPFLDDSPSSELLAKVVFEEMERRLPKNKELRVKCCDVWENDASRARYYPTR
ncbi:MAG: 6-carboxytetrahydropterin synthase QueD [Deltaproteobacteria bacterium]|nr:6-carboxytetrahydropterin synthase QueD [Deltaproteobacteria bacterium]MBN2673304.1 6-carboxytetrahydropterin synthase QueD [Deltaproteobacteria bacterium]